MARVWADETIIEFFTQNASNPLIRSKTKVLGGLAPFGCRKGTFAKTGPGMPFGHELGPMKLFLSFPAKTHQIHYFRSKTHVLGGFPPFRCRKCSVVKSDPRMPFWHEFGPTKLLSCFSAKAHPIHDFRSKTHVLGGFAPFGCRKCTVAKSGPKHVLENKNRFLFSSNEHAQSTTLGPKLMFSKVLRHFVDAPDLLRKLVSACI